MAGTQRVKYETNENNIFNVILDENTGIDTLIGTAPTGTYTENMTIRVSKNTKEVGIRPRMVLLARTINENAEDSNCLVQTGVRYKRVPVPTKTRWDEIILGQEFTIGGADYSVKKKINETVS